MLATQIRVNFISFLQCLIKFTATGLCYGLAVLIRSLCGLMYRKYPLKNKPPAL